MQSTSRDFSTRAVTEHRPPPAFADLCDRLVIGTLFLLAVAVPHSIAASQIAWSIGLLAWAVRLVVRPRSGLMRTPVDYVLLGFFVWTGVAAFASYAPDISIGKLRGASLFSIVYLVAQNVRSRSLLRALVWTLLASTAFVALFTLGERVVGRGVKVSGLTPASPLLALGVQEGDTLLAVDGERLGGLAELEERLRAGAAEGRAARLRFYHVEAYIEVDARGVRLLDGADAAARLGVGSAERGRDWRAAGFYGHYTTFAETLQLVIALALGLLVARLTSDRRWTKAGVALAVVVVASIGALLLTVTRASWLACFVASCVVLAAGVRSRRVLAGVAIGAVVLGAIGLALLQQKRGVGFFDRRDGSTTWRMTVYREGAELFVQNPRHLIFGVGMDSIKRFRNKWGLFDNGKLPPGHFHSTPLQLAVERGLPALLLWLALLAVYVRMLRRLWRDERLRDAGGWFERGLALGALGGAIGFFTGGLVHYNLGDSEVAMVFYFIMGCALVVERDAAGYAEASRIRKAGAAHVA